MALIKPAAGKRASLPRVLRPSFDGRLGNLRPHRQPPANFHMQSAMPLDSVDLLNQSFCVTQLLGLALRVNHSVN